MYLEIPETLVANKDFFNGCYNTDINHYSTPAPHCHYSIPAPLWDDPWLITGVKTNNQSSSQFCPHITNAMENMYFESIDSIFINDVTQSCHTMQCFSNIFEKSFDYYTSAFTLADLESYDYTSAFTLADLDYASVFTKCISRDFQPYEIDESSILISTSSNTASSVFKPQYEYTTTITEYIHIPEPEATTTYTYFDGCLENNDKGKSVYVCGACAISIVTPAALTILLFLIIVFLAWYMQRYHANTVTYGMQRSKMGRPKPILHEAY